MGDLPDPGGEVLSLSDEAGRIHVVLSGVGHIAVEDYIQELWQLGYSARAEGEDDDGGLMCSAVRDGVTVTLLFAPEGGDGLLQITRETDE